MIKKMIKLKKGLNLMSLLIITLLIKLTSVSINASELSIVPGNTSIYEGCYQPYTIVMNNQGNETLAVDTKLFLSGYFSFSPYEGSGYMLYQTGDMDNIIWPLTNGLATTGDNEGWTYKYINTTQLLNPIEGENVKIITLFLKTEGFTTSYLDFYYHTSNWNGDDSNISYSTGNNTKMSDSLTNVTGGVYNVLPYNNCPQRPWISSGDYQQYTYITTATGIQKTPTSIEAGHNYRNVFNISDGVFNNFTNSTGWTTWTTLPSGINTAVLLTINGESGITGHQGIQVISIQMFDDPNMSPIGNVADGRISQRQFDITGNILTGFLTFDNIVNNDGNTFQSGGIETKYDNPFWIDVFWIDTQKTEILTSSIYTGYGVEVILLSGLASVGESNSTSGWHADRTIMDDEFAIYKFSGNNTLKYGYQTTTDYNNDLIDMYGGNGYSEFTGGGFTMTKYLEFTQSRSGRVYYSDRAGNTGNVRIDVTVEPKADFLITIKPSFRESFKNKGTTLYGMSGYVFTGDFWLARHDTNNSKRVFSHNSIKTDGHSDLRVNENGTGYIGLVIPPSNSEFLVVFKGSGMLAMGFTGIRDRNYFNTGDRYFNFVEGELNTGTFSSLFPQLLYQGENFTKAGDIDYLVTADSYDYVNEADLNTINGSLTVGIDNRPALGGTVPYFYDFDLNRTISAIEQAIVIQFMENRGFISNFTTTANTITNLTLTDFYAAP